MYYFLGLVTDRDMKIGNIRPSYVLSSFETTSIKRAPWRVVKIGQMYETMPRVLVTSLIGNQLVIDFMSYWRALVPRKRGSPFKSKHRRIYIHGALFFFECDRRGNRTGKAVFIKRVPDREGRDQEDNLKRYIAASLYTPSLKELFSREPRKDDFILTGIRPMPMQFTEKSQYFYDHKQRLMTLTKERIKNGKSRITARRRVPHFKDDRRKRSR